MSAYLFGLWFLHAALRASVHKRGTDGAIVPLHVFEYAKFDIVAEIQRLQIEEIQARWPRTIALLRAAEAEGAS